MKFNIEDYLHKIDTAFQTKTKKDIQMIYVMVVAGIFAFSYLLFWDSSFEDFEATRTTVEKLQADIQKDKIYLQRNPESVINRLNQQIASLNKEITQYKEKNAYIKSKIETIASLIYDERTWGEYLDSVTTNAQKYHVKLLKFSNKYSKENESFGHILDISLSSEGSFKNTLQFINALEQSDLVVDIHDFAIESAPRGIASDINISVWGITY